MDNTPKLMYIDIADISPNRNNPRKMMDGIEELAQNIKHNGLIKPLGVYWDDRYECYRLFDGHRRFNALKLLWSREELKEPIMCLVYSIDSAADERMKLILSNAQFELNDEEKVEIVKELLDILKKKPGLKPDEMEPRDWIGTFIGCKGRTAQRYINLAKGRTIKEKKEEDNTYKYAMECFRDKLMTKVKIDDKKVTIYYTDIEDLNRLMELMGVIEE